MICPRCGYNDTSIPIPKISTEYSILGYCKKCDNRIDIVPRLSKGEKSQMTKVLNGEAREEVYTHLYMEYYGGEYEEKHSDLELDRNIYENGKLKEVIEIKIASCSLNAFRKTIFNYSKITYGKEFMLKYHIPVFFLIKFCDCWTRLRLFVGRDYERSKKPILPRYRREYKKYQKEENRAYHYVVYIPVDTLEILTNMNDIRTEYYFPESKIPKKIKLKDFF